MSELSVEQFLELWRNSLSIGDPLISRVRELCQNDRFGDGRELADFLQLENQLTAWQAERILTGRPGRMHLEKYRLLRPLGAGGMGKVMLAHHTGLKRRVAIKVLRQDRLKPQYIQRFLREARAAARLDHENAVRVYDVGHDAGNYFMVMEYVDGTSLQKLIRNGGALNIRTAADYVAQAARGLHHAHQTGLVHRDVKPGNLLLDSHGTVKVADMGLARMEDDGLASMTLMNDKAIGTVDFLAPEQAIDSHNVDYRADIYSLGCTLYFLLTAEVPFPKISVPAKLKHHLQNSPTPIETFRSDCPSVLSALCFKMMAKKAADRPKSALDVAVEIESSLAGFDATTRPLDRARIPRSVDDPKLTGPGNSLAQPASGPNLTADSSKFRDDTASVACLDTTPLPDSVLPVAKLVSISDANSRITEVPPAVARARVTREKRSILKSTVWLALGIASFSIAVILLLAAWLEK